MPVPNNWDYAHSNHHERHISLVLKDNIIQHSVGGDVCGSACEPEHCILEGLHKTLFLPAYGCDRVSKKSDGVLQVTQPALTFLPCSPHPRLLLTLLIWRGEIGRTTHRNASYLQAPLYRLVIWSQGFFGIFAFRRLITADKLEGAERFGKGYYLVVLELILGGQVEDGQARVRNLPSKSAWACQPDILSHLLFELWYRIWGIMMFVKICLTERRTLSNSRKT